MSRNRTKKCLARIRKVRFEDLAYLQDSTILHNGNLSRACNILCWKGGTGLANLCRTARFALTDMQLCTTAVVTRVLVDVKRKGDGDMVGSFDRRTRNLLSPIVPARTWHSLPVAWSAREWTKSKDR